MESAFQSGFASASLQVVLEKVATFAVNEVSLMLGVDDEIRKLQRTLQKIRAILDHVERNQLSLLHYSSHEVWKMWFADVEKLSCCAEDLLDEISLDLSRISADHSDEGSESHQVRNRLLSSFKLKMPHEINKIRKELEDIASEMDSFFMTKLSELGANTMPTISPLPLKNNYFVTSSLVDEGVVVGRENDKEDIIKMLMTVESSRSNFSVIPLVGMGGIGKTTLAQIVYNDNLVVKNFEHRIWIYVSVNFDLIKITNSIIESVTRKRSKLSDLDPIQSKLQNLLCGRKFLLVLDDYWTEDYGDWDALCSPLRVGSKGSIVIVTTRSTKVSSIIGTVPAYNLQSMTDENCWELIKQRAFSNGKLHENENLEQIGRAIAKKCKGLPLASKSLGGLLLFKSSEEEWSSVLQNECWNLPQDKNDIFSVLILSYYCLPPHLKKCFAYCSIFPHNHEYEMGELVLLWMAEGFIQPRGAARLEDIGCDYFKELTWRSLFQYSRDNQCKQPLYKMHDLNREMAQLVSANTCFYLEHHISQWHPAFKYARHLTLTHEGIQSLFKASSWCKKLRTILVMSKNGPNCVQVPSELFSKLRFLRVLDLSHMGIYELPNSIDNLKHLRYLNLSENHIQKLPESITNLLGLQTLKLEKCVRFLELPTYLKNLTNLRHLYLDVKHQLNFMPSGLRNLINLQTLDAFIVGRENGCNIGELGNMKFLRGSICITHLDNVLNIMKAKEAILCGKPFLNKLELEWGDSGDKKNQEEVLAGLRPHENLKELIITKYSGFSFPGWLSDPLCKLTSIHLCSCKCRILPSLGQLPLLKYLYMENMSCLERVDNIFCSFDGGKGFPSLESLIFQDMPKLIEWNGLGSNDLPHLRELSITNCPSLSSLPSLHNLNLLHNLNICRCPNLQALPEEGLPVSVQVLIILESAIIKERCRVDGEDWNKIRGIPKIEIDYVEISTVALRV